MTAVQLLTAFVTFGIAVAHAQDILYSCSGDWYLSGERCYRAFNGLKTFKDARQKCNEIGGSLAVVKNKSLFDDLVGGLSLPDDKKYWLGGKYFSDTGIVEWLDGYGLFGDEANEQMQSSALAGLWAGGQPQDDDDGRTCLRMAMKTKGLYDRYCQKENPFICEKHANANEAVVEPPPVDPFIPVPVTAVLPPVEPPLLATITPEPVYIHVDPGVTEAPVVMVDPVVEPVTAVLPPAVIEPVTAVLQPVEPPLLATITPEPVYIHVDPGVPTEDCRFSELKNHHSEGAVCVQDLQTLDACKDYCWDHDDCEAFDYNRKDRPWRGCRCWTHVSAFDVAHEDKWSDHYTKTPENCN